jgi:imidazolonepropionase-like amidohydrolase
MVGSLLVLPGAAPALQAGVVAITDVEVLDVEHGRWYGRRTVLLDGGRIVGISAPRMARTPVDAQRVDGRGRFLIPGLVDMHVHLFAIRSHRAPAEWSLPLYVANGVTAVREMNADAASIVIAKRWVAEVAAGERVAPRVLAAGIAVQGRSPADAAVEVGAAADAGADFIKIFSGVPATHWRAILDAARARSLPVAGHVPAGVPMLDAATAGQRSDEHLMQAYEACSTVETRLLEERKDLDADALVAMRDAQEARALDAFDAPTCRRIGRALSRTGQVQVPTLVLPHVETARSPSPGDDPRWRYLRSDERVRWQRILADLAAHPDPLARRRWDVSRGIVAALHRAGVPMLAGTDSPMPGIYPGYALHEELALLVEAGLSTAEVLRAATLGPARFLGVAEDTGSIAVGKRADLVLLDADPLADVRNTRRIGAVVLGGRLLDRAALDALLEESARAQAP